MGGILPRAEAETGRQKATGGMQVITIKRILFLVSTSSSEVMPARPSQASMSEQNPGEHPATPAETSRLPQLWVGSGDTCRDTSRAPGRAELLAGRVLKRGRY